MAENNNEIILENIEQNQEVAVIDVHDRAIMRKGTKGMFWVLILSIIAAVAISVAMGDQNTTLITTIVGAVCSLMQAICLLSMGKVNRRFTTAGILGLAALAMEALGLFVGAGVPALAVTVVNLVAELVMMYNMMMGYSETLKGVHDVRSRKWNSLWKWYIGVLIAEVVAVVLVFISPIVGALLAAAVSIAVLVVSIVLIVALGKTANIF